MPRSLSLVPRIRETIGQMVVDIRTVVVVTSMTIIMVIMMTIIREATIRFTFSEFIYKKLDVDKCSGYQAKVKTLQTSNEELPPSR